MRKLQLCEVEKLAQGHTTPAALEWQLVQSDCVLTTFCLSIYQLMDIWVVFTFATMNNVGFMFLCRHINLIFLSKYLRIGITGSYDNSMLNFLKNWKTVFQSSYTKIFTSIV